MRCVREGRDYSRSELACLNHFLFFLISVHVGGLQDVPYHARLRLSLLLRHRCSLVLLGLMIYRGASLRAPTEKLLQRTRHGSLALLRCGRVNLQMGRILALISLICRAFLVLNSLGKAFQFPLFWNVSSSALRRSGSSCSRILITYYRLVILLFLARWLKLHCNVAATPQHFVWAVLVLLRRHLFILLSAFGICSCLRFS